MKLFKNSSFFFILFTIISNTASSQNSIPCTGLDTDHEGVFAWNIAGTNTGHNIPAPYNAFGNDVAYYYFSSRDVENYDPSAFNGLHGSGSFTGFVQFQSALNAAGKSIADVKVRVSGPNLGNDIEGQDWTFVGAIETRFYKDGQYAILVDADTILVGQSGISTLIINYNSSSTPFDDQMNGYSDYSTPSIFTSDSTNLALANAFLNDIGQYGIRINFNSLQRAGQTEYNVGNIQGGFFEIQQAAIESGTLLIPDLGKDQVHCIGDSVMLDAGHGRDSYLWSTGDTTQQIYVKADGNYYVTIDSSGIKGVSAPVNVTFSVCTGVSILTDTKALDIFPNPASEEITIRSKSQQIMNQVEILDITGSTVLLKSLSSSSITIATDDFNPGQYLVKVCFDDLSCEVKSFIIY